MSNYIKSTSFSSKDSLPTGDPLKIVKGTEIDTEFNNIATAVASKADTNSPTFTGTPVAPTASAGTNTTQLATTAFVTAALQAVYPVGSIYINAASTTNPATLLGFGTWAEFGAGRVLVGQNTSDTLFDTLEETGGSKDAIVVSHNHTTDSQGSHQHFTVNGDSQSGYPNGITSSESISTYYGGGGPTYESYTLQGTSTTPDRGLTTSAGSHTHSVSTSGSSGTNANVQPFIVVKMWKRTA